MTPSDQRDPLGPLELLLGLAGALLVGLLVLTVALAVVGNGRFQLGDSCVAARNGTAAYLEGQALPRPPAGTQVVAATLKVCASSPDVQQRLLLGLHDGARPVFELGALALTLRLTRRARRLGFFTLPVARGGLRLGWYLVAGSLVAAAVEAVAKSRLLVSLLPGYGGIGGLQPSLPWSFLFAGCGVVALGRLLARAVPMREELDATV